MECSHWERSHCVFLYWSRSLVCVCYVVSTCTHFAGLQSTLLLALPLAPPQPWEGQQLVLVSSDIVFTRPPARSTEVRSRDRSSRASGPTLGAMEAAQNLAWPSPHVHMPTKPTAAKARPFPAAAAPVVCLDVPHVLNLQSWLRRCKSVAHTAAGRDFSPAS